MSENVTVKMASEISGSEAPAAPVESVVAPVEPISPVEPEAVIVDDNLEEGNEWSELTDEFDEEHPNDLDDVTPEVIPPEEPAIPPEEAEIQEPPVVEPEVVPPVVEPEAVTPEEVIPPVEEVPAGKSEEELQTDMVEARGKVHDDLLQRFSMSEEDGEAFMANPHEELPKMAAKLFMDVFDSVLHAAQSQVPMIVDNMIKTQAVEQQQEQAFYTAWPKLAAEEYRPTVDRVRAAYMQANPNVSAQQATQEIGAQSWISLRLPISELVALTQSPEVPVPAVSAVHTPASPGNAVASAKVPQTPVTTNPFTQLAEELILDDE